MIGIFIWTMIFLFTGVFIGYAIGSYLEMQKREEPRTKELKSLEVEKMSDKQSNLTDKEMEDLQSIVTDTLASVCAMADEHYCRCDSKVSENDDTKNKVTSLKIIVKMIDNKPYYEIKYKKVGEYYYHIGYSSFNIDNVLKWRDECFELVESDKEEKSENCNG